MAGHIRVFEESERKGLPLWAWLVPVLLLALLAVFFFHGREEGNARGTANGVASIGPAPSANALPTLGTVHFATGSATLSRDAEATLDRAAAALKGNAHARLRVEGYTDDAGTDAHNLTLSQQRAIAVATYLEGKGVDARRLSGEGFGPENPADTNATAAGKADNRRVELYTQP